MISIKPNRARHIRQKVVQPDDDDDDSGSADSDGHGDAVRGTGHRSADTSGQAKESNDRAKTRAANDSDNDNDNDDDGDSNSGPKSTRELDRNSGRRMHAGKGISVGMGVSARVGAGRQRPSSLSSLPPSSTASAPSGAVAAARKTHTFTSLDDNEDENDSEEQLRTLQLLKDKKKKKSSSHQRQHPATHDSSDNNNQGLDASHGAKHSGRPSASKSTKSLADIKAAYGITDDAYSSAAPAQALVLAEPAEDRVPVDVAGPASPSSSSAATVIPDSATIYAAKQRRERQRKLLAGEYVPLDHSAEADSDGDGDGRAGSGSGTSAVHARIIRDDVDDKDDAEEQFGDYQGNRISFGVKSKDQEKSLLRKTIRDALQSEDDSDAGPEDDDSNGDGDKRADRGRSDSNSPSASSPPELEAWEKTQIRKAGAGAFLERKLQDAGSKRKDSAPSALESMELPFDPFSPQSRGLLGFKRPPPHNYMPNIASLPQATHLAHVQARMNGRLMAVKDALNVRALQAERVRQGKLDAEQAIRNLTNSLDAASARFSYFQELRLYVSDLLNCLDAKLPLIQSAESAMYELFEKYGTLSAESTANDWDAAVLHAFTLERDALMRDSGKIFDDVLEDFRSISFVAGKLHEWRQLYRQTYIDAFVSLCVPQLLGPFVRFELLDWHPLMPDARDFTAMPWFATISSYKETPQHSASSRILNDDLDQDVLRQTLEKAVLPRVMGVLLHVWNPLSLPQTQSALRIVGQLCALFSEPPSAMPSDAPDSVSGQFRTVVSARIQEANDVSPQLASLLLDSNTRSILDLADPADMLQKWAKVLHATTAV